MTTLFLGQFIKTSRGKTLVLFNNYTYYYKSVMKTGLHRWSCTSNNNQTGRCNAFLTLQDDGTIIKTNEGHTHTPPHYYCNADGVYVKV